MPILYHLGANEVIFAPQRGTYSLPVPHQEMLKIYQETWLEGEGQE